MLRIKKRDIKKALKVGAINDENNLTHKQYPEIKSAYYIPGFENKDGVGVLLYFKKQFLVRRYLDEFDYIAFLNGEGIKRKGKI